MAYTPFSNGDTALSIRTKINNTFTSLDTNMTSVLAKLANLNVEILTFTNVTVATSAWVSDTTYANFPFRAPLACSGVLASDIPFVMFSATDQESGVYIGADSAANIIYIYASAVPTATVTVPLAFILRTVTA